MKKLLSLALALMMLTALFAACGEKTEEPQNDALDLADPNTPIAEVIMPEGSTELIIPEGQEPAEAVDTTAEQLPEGIVLATIDKTDKYTLVIENRGAGGDDRLGARAAEGKIEAGVYDESGTQRTAFYEFDYKELGLDGYAWEYLGAQVQIDTTGEKPALATVPDKSTFCVKIGDIEFVDDGKRAIVGGYKFELVELNHGMLRPNTLLNEGGQYIPKWNDHTSITCSDSNIFKLEKYTDYYYIFTKAEQFAQTMLINMGETTYPGAELPEGIK